MNIKSQKDFFSGLMFMGIGIAFAVGATAYDIGEAARMGPGYFPLWLGILMAVLGAIITFKALVVESIDGGKVGPWAWQPLIFVILANLVFGALLVGLPGLHLPAMGLVVSIYALTFIASMAYSGWKFKQTFILASVLALGSTLAFVVLLKLEFPVWPAFITG